MKIWLRIAAVLAVLLVLIAGTGLWIAQSDWLRDRIRAEIVRQVETATGGKVELQAFHLDWRTLEARIDRFVIHGTELPGSAPLLQVDSATVRLRILSLLRHDFQIDRVEVEHPQAHVIVYPGGRTNLPQPRRRSAKSPVGTILDLKIGKFDLRNGTFSVESPGEPPKVMPWQAQGRNLIAQIYYDAAHSRYSGKVSVAPLHVMSLDLELAADASLERNRVVVSHATIKTGDSELTLTNAVLNDFTHPLSTAQFNARVSLPEAVKLLKRPVKQSGTLDLAGAARYASNADYKVDGNVHGAGIASAFEATPARLLLTGIRVNALGGSIAANAEVRDYRTFTAKGRIDRFDLRQTAKLETSRPLPYDGLVSGPFEAMGHLDTLKPDVHAILDIATTGTGPAARGQVTVHYDAAKSTVELGQSWIQLPNSRVDASGTLGQRLTVKADSHDINDLLPAIDLIPDFKVPAIAFASASFNGTVNGPLTDPKIAGHATADGFTYNDQKIDSMAGDVTVSSSSAAATNAVVRYADLHGQGSASIRFTNWKASEASAIAASVDVKNADISKLLAMAGHKEVEFAGTLSTTAQITGTLANPVANADLTLTKGTIYSQPFDSITGRLQSSNKTTQTLTGLFVSGPKRVNISGRFEHAGTMFPAGTLDFNLTSNTMPLNQIALVRARQPDIHGFGKFHADGAIRIAHDVKHQIQFSLLTMNADASANSLELGGRNLGDARFVAQTQSGVLQASFDSNAAKAVIHGEGTVKLDGDYPVNAKIKFTKAGLNALAAMAVTEDQANGLNFDGELEGQVTVTGPALKPDELSAVLDITHVDVRALPGTDLAKALPDFVLTNAAPLRARATTSELRIENARFKAPETDLTLDGSIALTAQSPLNLRVQGSVNLALARTLSKDFTSSGVLALNATVRGDWKTPDVSGLATLRNGDFHYTDFSNGLTNANGEIAFNGTRANIQTFHAETGGGKVDATGFAALTGGLLNFRLEAKVQKVRIRYPEGVSSISDASFTLAGSSQRSEVSGSVIIHRVSINPKSDAANILGSAAEPIKTPAVKTGIFSNMNLDVRILTAPDVALQTSVAQSIEADANLTLRGTVTNPALLGRINVTQGELTFFGNKYSINQGTISFFNPARIDPIVNLDFETKARGVDVILTVSGPIGKLNVAYRSDPPLQFSDIVALLATGRAPTDATLAVSQTGQSQSFQQLGATDLLGQAIANPVAGRLQRFFGVSRLKIDPSLTGITGSPEARLTVEQQITPELLFTYITDVSSTSTQLIRMEWSFNPHWSAILIREENGYVALDFAYKKRFK
jgi:translocation and assembly module TamB